ncbi:MAG: hypothetical protein U9P80_09635 [Thermodesulfobacteriota bacterium]|nr:hypothetical protein [Thermodesulfobacteriota bacterium]
MAELRPKPYEISGITDSMHDLMHEIMDVTSQESNAGSPRPLSSILCDVLCLAKETSPQLNVDSPARDRQVRLMAEKLMGFYSEIQVINRRMTSLIADLSQLETDLSGKKGNRRKRP